MVPIGIENIVKISNVLISFTENLFLLFIPKIANVYSITDANPNMIPRIEIGINGG